LGAGYHTSAEGEGKPPKLHFGVPEENHSPFTHRKEKYETRRRNQNIREYVRFESALVFTAERFTRDKTVTIFENSVRNKLEAKNIGPTLRRNYILICMKVDFEGVGEKNQDKKPLLLGTQVPFHRIDTEGGKRCRKECQVGFWERKVVSMSSGRRYIRTIQSLKD